MKWQVTIEVSQPNVPTRWGMMQVVIVEGTGNLLPLPSYQLARQRLTANAMKGSGRFRIRETWECLE